MLIIMGNKLSYFKFLKKKRNKPNYGNYIIKVNDLQIDRIQQMHHILKVCCNNKNFFSPISNDLSRGIKVLDVGAGPGTWIFDMSSDYRKSEFTGIEIQSFMLPTIHPLNTSFKNVDILKGLPFSPNSFDFIHMRCMVLCFTEQQYEQIVRELVDLLKPNGYLELSEPELCSRNMGPICERFSIGVRDILSSKSMDPFVNEKLGTLLNDFGLQEINQEEVELPLSELDGNIGALYGETTFNGLIGLKDELANQMNLTSNEIDSLINDYREEIKSRRMYNKYTRVYGRKIIG
ncbi:S-adenosyl-L-methionine-dependent methyltransferase [Glomus cerebriforme]|uniref:S-adenosyl-L-methionine-dependent methyltransferase n=1 Tax=Glomus cerebriforme TaxID=658196 RepID=A0A397SNZ8_9GLOM|nr:S-adenosyl-L-methionine-dependent methyltransferase [Glomus cerebriforme]